jgi:osmotically-inducible protein OsmY
MTTSNAAQERLLKVRESDPERAEQIRERIVAALRHRAEVATEDANTIAVESAGASVTLRGRMASWSDRALAERTAWAVPGVGSVSDEIVVVEPTEPER